MYITMISDDAIMIGVAANNKFKEIIKMFTVGVFC